MRVEPASWFTQSRVAIVCWAVRISFASDSCTFFGGREPPAPGMAAELLLVMIATVTWLSRYTSFMYCARWKFELRFGRPTSAGFHGKFTRPSSSGRLFGLKVLGLPSAMSRSAFPGPVRLERMMWV